MAGERHFGEIMLGHYAKQQHVCAGVDIKVKDVASRINSGVITREDLPEAFDSHLTDGELVKAYAVRFMEAIAEAGVVATVKPNIQIYRALRRESYDVLEAIRDTHHSILSDTALVFDAKIQDIGSTNEGTDEEIFDYLDGDGVTVHGYLGADAFADSVLKRKNKGVYVLARTSNKGPKGLEEAPFRGARQIQDLWVSRKPDTVPTVQLFEQVAQDVRDEWRQYHKNVGVVAGGNFVDEAGIIRRIIGPRVHMLIPGVGTQGGTATDIVPVAVRAGEWAVINSSSGLSYAEKMEGETQWQACIRTIRDLHNETYQAQIRYGQAHPGERYLI